jgi:phage terminase large subunit-like protein
MASNVVARLDAKDNIYPRKERAENKIDGIVALIMAIVTGDQAWWERGAGIRLD